MFLDLALGGSATLDLGHRTLDKKQRVPFRDGVPSHSFTLARRFGGRGPG
jgi:hypothetical protein